MGSTAITKTNLTPMDLMQLAIDKEGSIDVIERLAKLQQDFMDREAKVAYADAMTQFKEDLPVILRTKKVEFESKRAGASTTSYSHAELDKVCDTLIPALVKLGITHRWKSTPLPDGRTQVTCYLKHRLGYEEEGATMAAPPEQSGNKNAVQAVASTVTMLERYTLIATVGVAVKGEDTDGVPKAAMKGLDDCLKDLENATDKAAATDIWKRGTAAAREAGDGHAVLRIMDAFEEAKKRIGGIK